MRSAVWGTFLVVVIGIWLMGASAAGAQNNPATDQTLAQKFAPVLYFHPSELFHPQAIDGFVNTARLRVERRFWFDVNLISDVSISDLLNYHQDIFFLDTWFGSEAISDSKNYDSHRNYYANQLSPDVGGSPVVAYAHVNRNENPDYITIQYWLFYYYNDWFNKHEGDWEMVEVILSNTEEPLWVVLSQHHGGTRRSWNAISIEESTHPVVYVALGSHANYFWGNETYPNGMDIGNTRVEIMDRTGSTGRVIPAVELIPDPALVERNPGGWNGMEWILFGGHWGETAQQGDFGGPQGPAFKGDQWQKPYAWGTSQPLDAAIWYANRLRVQVPGDGAISRVQSTSDEALLLMEIMGNTALLHRDLAPGESITVEIQTAAEQSSEIAVTLPDSSAAKVTRYSYTLPALNTNGFVSLTLTEGKEPLLISAGKPLTIAPSSVEEETFTWETPDLIWLPGLLSTGDLLKGLLFCLLAGWLPALIYVGILYWADRYEKEPLSLLAAAFLWGAIPALLIALILRIFIRLPVELLGSNAIETVRSGLISPLVEETLKGAVVIFIALRYRREFDDVLDGIIYGGIVGLGFAMNANIISYLGSFLTRGFAGLGNIILNEGIIYSLNHAFYSAIFGTGMGYARLATKRWQRWAIPLLAYLLAVLSHSTHNLLIRNALGLNPFTVVLSLMGILVIVVVVVWSLRNQQRCLQVELAEELPNELYQTVVRPGRRFYAQWQTLLHKGFRAWWRLRRTYQLCMEFAFKRMQARLFPEEDKIVAEAQALREKIGLFAEAE